MLPIPHWGQEQLREPLTSHGITGRVRHLKTEPKNCHDSPRCSRQLICFLCDSWI